MRVPKNTELIFKTVADNKRLAIGLYAENSVQIRVKSHNKS